MELIDLLRADDVVFGIREPDVGAAAARLLRTTLPRRGFAAAEVERLVNAVIARERETPTLCGNIAIPHARDAALSDFVAAIAVNPAGVVGDMRVLIAFLSPESRRSEHLDLLARLARLSRDAGAISAIAAATDAKGVLEVIRERPR